MFNLIVVVISIALLAIIAVASIFYGGDAWTQSSEKANVTTLINQGQQISGAAALYKADTGVTIADESAEVTAADVLERDGYLSNVPAGVKATAGSEWVLNATDGQFEIAFDGGLTVDQVNSICAEVTKQGAGSCVDAATHAEGAEAKFAFPL